jgi:hypothetical protein
VVDSELVIDLEDASVPDVVDKPATETSIDPKPG